MSETQSVEDIIKSQFEGLPKVVQTAITSAEMTAHLRKLSERHLLHLDQWQILENEVIMTVLGLKNPDALEKNIQNEVGVTADVARELTNDVTNEIFEPIRIELEKSLSTAEQSAISPVAIPNFGPQKLVNETEPEDPTIPRPPEPPKVKRASLASTAVPGVPNLAARQENDPYREPIV